MKKEKKGKKKSKALVIILGIFLTFVVIMGVREINRFIHVGKITKIDSEEKEIGCPAVMSFVYNDLFYIIEYLLLFYIAIAYILFKFVLF